MKMVFIKYIFCFFSRLPKEMAHISLHYWIPLINMPSTSISAMSKLVIPDSQFKVTRDILLTTSQQFWIFFFAYTTIPHSTVV